MFETASIDTLFSIFANVGFPGVLLWFIWKGGNKIWKTAKPILETIGQRTVTWFDAQTTLVQTLKESLNETRTSIADIATTQQIMAREQIKLRRLQGRVVDVMEKSPCVSKDEIRQALKEHDSDQFDLVKNEPDEDSDR